jgi:hypothetical protein
MRALSWLAGLLSAACAYRLGAAVAREADDLDPRLVGFGTAAAVGGSAFVVYYLHEIRVYALHLLLAVLAIWSYWQALRPRRSRWALVGLTLSWAGLLYSHFFGALLLGALGLYHLVAAPRGGGISKSGRDSPAAEGEKADGQKPAPVGMRHWWVTSAAMLASGVLFLPWVIVALSAGPAEVDPVLRANALTPGGIVERLLFMFSNGGLGLLVILLVMSGMGWPARAVWFWLAALVGAAAAGNVLIPVISELRYLLAAWPLLALLVGLGAARLSRRGAAPALIWGAWLAAGVWGSLNATPLLVAFQSLPSATVAVSAGGAGCPRPGGGCRGGASPGCGLGSERGVRFLYARPAAAADAAGESAGAGPGRGISAGSDCVLGGGRSGAGVAGGGSDAAGDLPAGDVPRGTERGRVCGLRRGLRAAEHGAEPVCPAGC